MESRPRPRLALVPLPRRLLLALLAVGTASALVWEFETVDSIGVGVGFEPSLALDAAGNPAIASNHPSLAAARLQPRGTGRPGQNRPWTRRRP